MEKTIQIPPPRWEVSVQDYIEHLSEKDPEVLERLKAFGFPSQGLCRLSETPGEVYGRAYKGFTVHTAAVLLGNKKDLPRESFSGIMHGDIVDNVERAWRIWLMDVVRNEPDQDSLIRCIWNEPRDGSHITIEYIHNDFHRHTKPGRSGNATRIVMAQLKHLLPGLRIITFELMGRPEGSGWFKGVKDFRTALKAVLATQISRPTQLKTLKLLDEHQLCQLKSDEPRTQSHTKLLRHWLHKAGFKKYDEALRRYWNPPKKRK